MVTNSDELHEQIAALRSEVRQLSESFTGLRDEEIRRVFSRQVRTVLDERTDRALCWPGSSRNGPLRASLAGWMDGALGAFEHGGRAEGLRYVERRSARSVVDEDSGFVELAEALEEQVRSYLDTYGQVVSRPDGARLPVRTVHELSPERVEATLAPLSNGIRIALLQHLAREDDGLAAMARALGLQKGHLQFHLRSLLHGWYIDYDRKSRLYALSARGRRALDGLGRLMDELEDEE